MSRHRPRGLASRFFLAQTIVVIASILAAVLAVSIVGPAIFPEAPAALGPGDATQLMHVEQAYRDTNLWTLGMALATALVCALGVTLVFTRRLQRPIDALTHAAQAMARSRYDTRVPAMGAGAEVDALAGAFNTMAAQLERTEDTRRRMLSDLAHEMRTPISVLTVYLEALQDEVAHWDETTSELMGNSSPASPGWWKTSTTSPARRRAASSWTAPNNLWPSWCARPPRPTGRPTPPKAWP